MKQVLNSFLFILVLIFTNHAMAQDGTGVVTVTSNGGSCLAFTPANGNGPDDWEVAEGGNYIMTIAGVTECSGDTITVFVQSNDNGNFCFNAVNDGSGNYSGAFTVPSPACNTMPISYKCGASQPCNNDNSYSANGQSDNHSVHLRASIFDADCNKTGDDTNCELPCTLKLTFTCKKPKCFGDANGSINIIASGAQGTVTYLWNDGVTTEDRTGLVAGTYTVTATDANGCTAVLTKTIGQPSAVTINESHVDASSNGGSDGSINITVTGGSGRKSYLWNDGVTTEDRFGLSAGSYTVTATDKHGCSSSKTIDIAEPQNKNDFSQMGNSSIKHYPNPVQNSFTLEVKTNENSEQEVKVFVENLLGQVVFASVPEEFYGSFKKEISFNQPLNDGLYVIRVIAGNKELTEHLIVQHSK